MTRSTNNVTRLRRVALGSLLAATGLLVSARAPSPDVDLLIVGGQVIDGTSRASTRHADIGVTGDKISFVGDASATKIRAKRTINAAGRLVTPGFIDPHTHSGDDLASADLKQRAVLNHVMQGVTTVVIGNDGGGGFAVPELFDSIRRFGTGVNVATLVGFGPVRRQVVGEVDRAATPAEIARMRELVARGMCAGALGFSTGLYYAPQSFAPTAEVVALAREAAARGGLYETHLREEGSGGIGLIAAVEEALAVGREARLPVHIAHIKALGVDVHGTAPAIIARIGAARRAGLRVTADQYPWSASGTRLTSALAPRWALDGGLPAFRARLDDTMSRSRLRVDMTENLRRRGGANHVLITGGAQKGKRLDAIATNWRTEPVDAAIRIVRDEGDATIASFNMSNRDIAAFAKQPWVVGSSDASDGHPRKFGSFAERWLRFVRAERLLTPAEFVHRSSGMTAAIFGIKGRGTIRVGNYADMVIFDPARFSAKATYENPALLAEGVQTVLVNGRLAVDRGRSTGTLAGRAIAKARDPKWSCPV